MINTLSSFFPVVTNGTVVVVAFVPVGPVFRCFNRDDDAGGDDGDVIFSFLISARLFRILAFGDPVILIPLEWLVAIFIFFTMYSLVRVTLVLLLQHS